MPLFSTGDISAVRVNRTGAVAPIPIPAKVRSVISAIMLVDKHDSRLKSAFIAIDTKIQNLRPTLSAIIPPTNPPNMLLKSFHDPKGTNSQQAPTCQRDTNHASQLHPKR